MNHLNHLTIATGHVRKSPRTEVEPNVIAMIRSAISDGSGALWNTGWAVFRRDAPDGGYSFDLSSRGNEVARCWIATTQYAADIMWKEAETFPRPSKMPVRPALPWLAVGLLPDGLGALSRNPGLIVELGDLERCVAWSVLPND